jgi:hypothetical protein
MKQENVGINRNIIEVTRQELGSARKRRVIVVPQAYRFRLQQAIVLILDRCFSAYTSAADPNA